ncbi:MAG: DUF1289 domain-containing protein [Paraperlucidibaca sp.]
MPFETVPTPCVGICSTTYGDTVCRGCRRYLHEVIDWNRYSAEQKRLIWQRLDGLLAQIMPRYFEISDAQQLRRALDQMRLSYRFEASPWTWLHILLKNAARQLTDLTPYGVRRLDTSSMILYELKELVNGELYTLASAYYERDLLRALQYQLGQDSDA